MAQEAENIKTTLIEDEIKDSYLNYAMSVIVSRALPDVRDGLKPSQRRILVAMNDLSLGPRAKFRKCAKIAGDTSGNYHPHGEMVVYPTLVRMAQDFVMRYPLIEGQGNFGSIDGDPPAAMRYTEARLTDFAMLILEDLDKNTVDFVPNYDETREEPTVLPSKFPNLISCGSSGIAVGMATSIPPHNLSEVCDAIIKLIENPDITVSELMTCLKGPDFPTGGVICGLGGLKEAYETGHGRIIIRGKLKVEERKGRKSIVATEIPYNQNKAKLIEQIAELVKKDRLQGISDIRDESDREGMRIVIEVKQGENENVVINQLYASTFLQDTFSINMIALINNRPQLFNLKELLEAYKNHRVEVIRRRTKFLLDKAEFEAHILEGLSKALEFIDEVIDIIKKSANTEIARDALISRFQFTQPQVEAILKMTLGRLTNLEQDKIHKDLDELNEKIIEYKITLANDNLILDIIREDLYEMKEKYGDKRLTEISAEDAQEFLREELIPEEDMVVALSHEGYIKRTPLTSYRKQKGRGGVGIIGAETKEKDFIEHLFVASTHDYILFFTELGKVYRLKVYEIPQLSRTSRGKPLINLLSLKEGEKITKALSVKDFSEGYLVMATRKGLIKKTDLSEYSNIQRIGKVAIKLEDGDKLIGANITDGEQEIVLGTANGLALRFLEKKLRPMGRTAYGNIGIRFRREDDYVVDMVIVDKEASLLTVCENGYGKRTTFDKYRLLVRYGGKGVKNINTSKRNGKVIGLKAIKDKDELMLITQHGMVVCFPIKDVRQMRRATQGVKLIRLHEGDNLVSIAIVVREETAEGFVTLKPEGEFEKTKLTAEEE